MVDVPVPSHHHRRSKVVDNARVALLAVLIAPVGVVEIAVGQPVALVGGSALSGPLSGVAPGDDAQRVAVVELLLGSEKIGERVVECARYVAGSHACPAVGDVGREGPSVLAQSRVVGVDATQRVVAVGSSQRCILSGRHVTGTEVVVVGTAHGRHREVVGLEGQCSLATLVGDAVQAAYERIAELAALHVVHRGTVDVDLIVLLIKSTVAEAHRTEQISHLRGVDVLVRRDDGHILRHVVILAQLSFREGEGLFARNGVLSILLLGFISLGKGRRSDA